MDMMIGDNAKATGKAVKFRVQLTGEHIPEGKFTITVVKEGGKFGTFETDRKMPVVEFTYTPKH